MGAVADVAVLDLLKGKFGYRDSYEGKIGGDQRLVCDMTLFGGKVVWDWNARTGVDYRELGPTYGVRHERGLVFPPRDS